MYKELQLSEVEYHKVILDEKSVCWQRTHVHVKERRICKHTPKESYPSLLTLLHEIGHIYTDKSGMKRCEQESEATMWAVNRLKELGLPIKRKYIKPYKDYIRMTYNRGVRRGLSKKIKSKLYI
jgi:hypothetical protein